MTYTEREALEKFCNAQAEHHAAADAVREARVHMQVSYRMMVNAAIAFAQAAAVEQARPKMKYTEPA